VNRHETTIHARCPYAPTWDYYQLTFETNEHLKCEDLQDVCDKVRGKTATQEDVFELIASRLKATGKLTLIGQHGTNGRLVISESVPSVHAPFVQRCGECGSQEISLPTSSDTTGVCADCGAEQ
jgi:hypothetical protein